MAIEDILRALEEQGQADCEACTEEARAHAAQILEDAQEKANSIHEHHISSIERAARTEAMKRVNAARLKGRMQVSGVRGEGLDGVFDSARQQLAAASPALGLPAAFASLAARRSMALKVPS